MSKSHLIKFDWIILICICLFTLTMAIYAAQPWGDNYAYKKLTDYFFLFGMMLWAISPYFAMIITLSIFSKKEILIKTYSIGMLIISLLAGFILFDSMFIHIDAQGGLIFLFLPIYQWLAFFILLFICAAVYKFTKQST